MTTFKCIRSGNVVSFDNEDDIAQLRKHEGYMEVLDERPRTQGITEEGKEGKDAEEKVLIEGTITLKKRGRPKKNE